MRRIFISYSNADKQIADDLCAGLEAHGMHCWIAPRDISPTREWAEEIINGINNAHVMMLVFSQHSNESPQVRREVERAIHKEIAVIPVRVENVVPTKSLEYFLSSQHWFDAYLEPISAYASRLCALINGHCEHEQPSAQPRTFNRRAADRSPEHRSSGGERRGDLLNNERQDGNLDFTQASPPPSQRRTDLPARPSAEPPAAPVPPPAASAPPAAAPDNRLPDNVLKAIETELAKFCGPIARVLVRNANKSASSPAALLEALAQELDSGDERNAFLSACRRILAQ